MRTSDFEWLDTPECYQFIVGVWDVAKAKQFIIKKPRDIVNTNVSSLKGYVKRPVKNVNGSISYSTGHNIDWELIDTGNVDLSFPLIGIIFPGIGPWIIDGWHRMAKGFELGQEVFSVAMLDEKESKKVRLR